MKLQMVVFLALLTLAPMSLAISGCRRSSSLADTIVSGHHGFIIYNSNPISLSLDGEPRLYFDVKAASISEQEKESNALMKEVLENMLNRVKDEKSNEEIVGFQFWLNDKVANLVSALNIYLATTPQADRVFDSYNLCYVNAIGYSLFVKFKGYQRGEDSSTFSDTS